MRKHYTFKDLDLYHKDVFIPEGLAAAVFLTPPRYLRLSYSSVARSRAEKDNVPIQEWITLRPDNVIEVGCAPPVVDGYFPSDISLGNIDTVVVREPFSADKDILLSIAVDFQQGYGTVKMAWTHVPGRPHFSLKDKREYIPAPRRAFNPVFAGKLEAAI